LKDRLNSPKENSKADQKLYKETGKEHKLVIYIVLELRFCCKNTEGNGFSLST